MNCERFKSTLHGYFSETLPAGVVALVEEHAGSCDACGHLMAVAREISCRDLVEFLNDYIDGELSPERKAVFERHLAICSDCSSYLDSYRRSMELSVAALLGDRSALPQNLPEELVRAILEARRRG